MTAEEPEEEPWLKEPLFFDPPQLGGVWANWARVVPSDHEFTIDFVRIDYASGPPYQGIIVARVAFSAVLLAQLTQTLEETLQEYTEGLRKGAIPDERPEQ